MTPIKVLAIETGIFTDRIPSLVGNTLAFYACSESEQAFRLHCDENQLSAAVFRRPHSMHIQCTYTDSRGGLSYTQCGQICDRGHGVVTGSLRFFISGHQVTALKLLFRGHRAQTWTRLSDMSNTS